VVPNSAGSASRSAARSSAGRTRSSQAGRDDADSGAAAAPRTPTSAARVDRHAIAICRQFMNQGDRLAFSNGILMLSAFAAI
jgi:hypothetical protein